MSATSLFSACQARCHASLPCTFVQNVHLLLKGVKGETREAPWSKKIVLAPKRVPAENRLAGQRPSVSGKMSCAQASSIT